MQSKLLEGLVENLAGVDTGRIVDILFNKKDVNEFLIAKKMDLTINQVRNILYKLSNEGLVSFVRKKDKRRGWYIYYWTLSSEKCLVRLEQALILEIEQLNNLLNGREEKRYYVCKTCDVEVSEETALEHDFSCEECADVYELSDNSALLKEIRLHVARVERNLKAVQDELATARERVAVKLAREAKKVAKEKEKETAKKVASRRKVALENRATKKATANKIVKKAAKKKVAKKKAIVGANKKGISGKSSKVAIKKRVVGSVKKTAKKTAKKIAKKIVKKKGLLSRIKKFRKR